MLIRRSFVLLVALTLVFVSACSGDEGGETTTTAPADGNGGGVPSGITIDSFTFTPGELTVSVGDTVTWTNEQGVGHTATADGGEWNSGTLPTGGEFSHTFDESGTFTYFCSIHPSMTGEITVNG